MANKKQRKLKTKRIKQGIADHKQRKQEQESAGYFPKLPEWREEDTWQSYAERCHGELPDTVRDELELVEPMLLRYNTFDFLANLVVSEILIVPETYKEPEHAGSSATMELATLVYLKHPFNNGERIVDGLVFEDIRERLRSIVFLTMMYHATAKAMHDDDPEREATERLCYQTKTNELLVRGPAYPHHQSQMLHALFVDLSDWLTANVGFSVDDAIAIRAAVSPLLIGKLASKRDESVNCTKSLSDAVRTYKRTGQLNNDEHTEQIEYIAHLPAKQARSVLQRYAIYLTFNQAGDMFSFTADEMADESGVPVERVASCLQFFTTPFESTEKNLLFISPTHALKSGPFICHSDRYMIPAPELLLWAIKPRLETILNPNTAEAVNRSKRLWDGYVERRARYLEEESLRLLGDALKHATVHHRLKYRVLEDGVEKECELDGLVLFDTNLLLVECKAGAFTDPARRGAPGRLRRDVNQILADAHAQAARTIDYLDSHPQAEFTSATGEKVVIERDKYLHVFPIAVSLDCMEVLQAVLYEVAELGVFAGGELPWAVYINDLRVISELVEFPCQLVHYLQRRKIINKLKQAVAHDELDWFGNYLFQGLYFQDIIEKKDIQMVYLGSHTVDFDDYYFYEQGMRETPVEKPKQVMPPLLHKLITELEHVHAEGYSSVVCALLDMSGKSREELIQAFQLVRRKTQQDGHMHDFSLFFNDGNSGFTVFSTKLADTEEAVSRLNVYADAKKHQLKADSWVGLLTVTDTPGLIDGWVTRMNPWKPNVELDEVCRILFGDEDASD